MSLLEMLGQQLGGSAVEQISQQMGADKDTTGKAVSAALPMIVAALAKNSSQEGGAGALLGALDRDHDGSILDDVSGFLGGGGGAAGAAILGHMLGGRQGGVENAVSSASGLDAGKAGELMATLAPLVMAALARQRQSGSLDADGLAGMLAGEQQRAEKQSPQAMGMVGKLLDADGDGDVTDDLVKLGSSLLGKMFSR
jgi:hypothetical protein